jgi:hypothetical protein
MNKRILLLVLVLLASASFIWILLSGSSSNLSDLKVCSSLAASGSCSSNQEKVSTDEGDIYASVHVRAPSESILTIKWVYVLDGVESQIAEGEKEVSAVGYQSFKLARPETGWQEGRYRLEVEFLSDELTVEFEIR